MTCYYGLLPALPLKIMLLLWVAIDYFGLLPSVFKRGGGGGVQPYFFVKLVSKITVDP